MAESPSNGKPADAAFPASVLASAPPSASKSDVVILGPPTADGAGVHVLRARNEGIETGELRGIQEGKPLVGEIVTLKPREANGRICDVTDSFVPPAHAAAPTERGHKGPARVATEAYREGWESIFGAKPSKTTPPSPAN